MLDTAQAVRRSPGRTTSGPARPARRRPRLGPYLLILPALVTITVQLVWPVVQSARMSFQKVGLRQLRGEPAENVGLDNYRQILGDGFFWTTVRHTVLFAADAVAAAL